ncbi:MAG: DUF3089 domain-containing protein [Cyclobacteriaceae bacterium]|nr:DUF3089 domain-containing protein [Cyclobacteriaceae bacterium HetDA_MAG_MS6]
MITPLRITCLILLSWMLSFHFLHAQKKVDQYSKEDLQKLPAPPSYVDLRYWAAHPDQSDAADMLPGDGELEDRQSTAMADVFFVHPTIYTDKQHPDYPWNASLQDQEINKKVDESTIKNQASIFNGSARVYAPRYRQAHINVFKTSDLILKQEALDLAYLDVQDAFEHYLKHLNDGRPIILASHSQGTLHAARLIRDFFENKPIADQLVAAYLVGMPLATDLYESIPPCTDESSTGCWVSWNTYAKGYYPPNFQTHYANALSTNPLNWQVDATYAPAEKNKGGVLRKFDKIRPSVNDAINHRGLLWISKPRFFGNFLTNWKRYHVADYNLFYMNVRENVATRTEAFIKVQKKAPGNRSRGKS